MNQKKLKKEKLFKMSETKGMFYIPAIGELKFTRNTKKKEIEKILKWLSMFIAEMYVSRECSRFHAGSCVSKGCFPESFQAFKLPFKTNATKYFSQELSKEMAKIFPERSSGLFLSSGQDSLPRSPFFRSIQEIYLETIPSFYEIYQGPFRRFIKELCWEIIWNYPENSSERFLENSQGFPEPFPELFSQAFAEIRSKGFSRHLSITFLWYISPFSWRGFPRFFLCFSQGKNSSTLFEIWVKPKYFLLVVQWELGLSRKVSRLTLGTL